MKDYTRECWCCGQQSMESKGEYYQCSECGATWNPLPKPGANPLGGTWLVRDIKGGFRHRSPGPGALTKRDRAIL